MPDTRVASVPALYRCRGVWLSGLVAFALALPMAGQGAAAAARPPVKPATPSSATEQPLMGGSRIAAVVNGDVISQADIANRARLFAISTGLPLSQDVIDRLKPQILRQLIDERLRVQEAQRRKIVIGDAQIAAAIHEIESRNNLPPGALRQKLAADGVSQRTLIDQIRAQLAWSQMLHDTVAEKVTITDADVAEQQKLAAQRIGQTVPAGGNLHPGGRSRQQRGRATLRGNRDQRTARRRALRHGRRSVQPDPDGAGGW